MRMKQARPLSSDGSSFGRYSELMPPCNPHSLPADVVATDIKLSTLSHLDYDRKDGSCAVCCEFQLITLKKSYALTRQFTEVRYLQVAQGTAFRLHRQAHKQC